MPAAPEPARPPAANLPLWLGLTLTPGLGTRGIHKLLQAFHSPEAIHHASLTSLEACGILPAAAQSIHSGKSAELGAREAGQALLQGVTVLTFDDRDYPALLREIPDPPPLLYLRGAVAAVQRFAVAVVGTRRPTVYGRLMASRLGAELAAWGLCVVSGMARGIDSLAQTACVEAGGCSVAVFGCGVDVIYPKENARLAGRLLDSGGALVSELPLGTIPAAHNFPLRNRIISGLSLGVLVVEGGEYSGSRITARMALEHDREVMAVPGMVTQKQAWLPNTLLRQGAKLVAGAADVVDELPASVRVRLTAPPPAPSAPVADASPHSAQQAAVLNVLQAEQSTHVDEIAERLDNGLSAPELLTLLFDLEMAGKVRQLPGKNYLRVC